MKPAPGSPSILPRNAACPPGPPFLRNEGERPVFLLSLTYFCLRQIFPDTTRHGSRRFAPFTHRVPLDGRGIIQPCGPRSPLPQPKRKKSRPPLFRFPPAPRTAAKGQNAPRGQTVGVADRSRSGVRPCNDLIAPGVKPAFEKLCAVCSSKQFFAPRGQHQMDHPVSEIIAFHERPFPPPRGRGKRGRGGPDVSPQ